ncbi:MAG TPA: IclR family transcriptional regulator [Gryllotalpicola sp.]
MSPHAAPIKVLVNSVELIEALAAHGPLTPAELAERIDVPRSSAYRLVDGLAAIGLADTLADGRIRLSLRWLQLADAARDSLIEWAAAAQVLERLVEQTGQTAFLSVLAEDEAVCIDWRRGRGVDVLALKPGRALPLYAGAAGRVMLAYGVDTEDYLSRGSFTKLTPDTITDPELIRREAALTRERGYALSEQDVSIGISALGVPVFRPDGAVAAAVSIGGLSRAFGDDPARFTPALDEAAAILETALAGEQRP